MVWAELPAGLLRELGETTLALNMETSLDVIQRIEAQTPETARQLRVLVQGFKFARIREFPGAGTRQKDGPRGLTAGDVDR